MNTSIMDESRVKPIVKKKKKKIVHIMIERKQTFIKSKKPL